MLDIVEGQEEVSPKELPREFNCVTGSTVHCSDSDLQRKFDSMGKGCTVVYAQGDLAADKYFGGHDHTELVAVSRLALELSERRRACLTQKRIAKYKFDYLITKARED